MSKREKEIEFISYDLEEKTKPTKFGIEDEADIYPYINQKNFFLDETELKNFINELKGPSPNSEELRNYLKNKKFVCLKAKNINSKMAQYLAIALENNISVHALDLSYNQELDYEGIEAICNILKFTKIKILSLDYVIGKTFSSRKKKIQLITDTLIENKTITGLSLRGNWIDDDVISVITNMLSTNKTIHFIDLSYNMLFDGLLDISEMLEKNNTLRSLRLLGSSLGRDADMLLNELGKAINKNKSLVHLSLGHFYGYGTGTDFLKELKSNHTLLDIQFNLHRRVDQQELDSLHNLIINCSMINIKLFCLDSYFDQKILHDRNTQFKEKFQSSVDNAKQAAFEAVDILALLPTDLIFITLEYLGTLFVESITKNSKDYPSGLTLARKEPDSINNSSNIKAILDTMRYAELLHEIGLYKTQTYPSFS